MSNVKFFIFLLALVILLGLVWFLGNIFLETENASSPGVVFSIHEGQGLAETALSLQKDGVVKSRVAFEILALLTGKQAKIKAGDYVFPEKISPWQVLDIISNGGNAKKRIILEGWTIKEIAEFLEKNGLFSRAAFMKATNSQSAAALLPEFYFLSELPANATLEGFLFPDSYEFSKKESAEAVVKKMLSNFNQKVLQNNDIKIGSEVGTERPSLYETLIMASLIEREVKTKEDKQVVAGILWKRLQNDWPLQVDATLVYALGKPGSQLVQSDKEIDSPYNTYKHKGLPPTPICNPGLDSIQAAIEHQPSPYWYYISKPDGATVFSKTLEEHNIARAKYLR